MNCYTHPTQVAVAQCIDCNKGLCVDCSRNFKIPICKSCNQARLKSENNQNYIELAGNILMMFIGYYLTKDQKDPLFTAMATLWFFPAVISGYRFLNRIQPSMFLFLPLIGWAVYFLVKGILGFFVGLIVYPIRFVRNIINIINATKKSASISKVNQ